MSNFYSSPFGMSPALAPEQSTISLGPYTQEQAPFIECANCGTAITVGQRLTLIREWFLGIDMKTGQLAMVPPTDWEGDFAYVHSDCSAEFAHDQITKEPCGQETDEDEKGHCTMCGVALDDRSKICDWCAAKLAGRTG
jgi:ribosomal protein L37E